MPIKVFNKDNPLHKKEILEIREIVRLQSENGEIKNYLNDKEEQFFELGCTFCFLVDGRIVSFIRYSNQKINLIATHPDHRQQGYARSLVENIQSIDSYITATIDAIKFDGIVTLLSKCGFIQKNKKEWCWSKYKK